MFDQQLRELRAGNASGFKEEGMKERLRRNKRSTPKAFASRQLNAQRPTLNAKVAEIRLKAGLRVES